MRPFLLACFVALAAARPEPPVGYSYQAPSGGHSIGGGSLGGGSLSGGSIQYASNGGYSYANSGGHGGSGGGLSLVGHSGGHGDEGFGGHSSFGNGGLGGGHGVSSGFDSSSAFTGGLGGHGGSGGVNGGQFGGFGGGLSYAPQAPTVHKHVYVHVAPEEPEERRAPQHIPVAAPQKHYKIIFIKAPAPPTPAAPIIPVQPQNEEKTLVYVLVKKPEEQPELVIPTAAPTQPSKPEVYFIRYKTQKEQSHGRAAISGGADYQGPSGIDASGPGSGVIANTGLEGLGGHGGPSSLGGDLGSGPSFTSGGSGGGISYIPPSTGHASSGASGKYGPPGYQK